MTKKRLKTTPSSKLINAMSKHPEIKGSCPLTITLCTTHNSAPHQVAYIAVTLGDMCTVYCEVDATHNEPAEMLHAYHLDEVSTEDGYLASDSTGMVQAVAFTYLNESIRDFLECASDELEFNGNSFLEPAVITFLKNHPPHTSKGRVIDHPEHLIWYPIHKNSSMDSTGLVSYEDMTEFYKMLKTDYYVQYTASFSIHDDHGRMGVALCDGGSMMYLPDDDPICESPIRIDKHILKTVKGRGYHVLDLQTDYPHLSLTGLLPTGEGFCVKWRTDSYVSTNIGLEAVQGIYHAHRDPAPPPLPFSTVIKACNDMGLKLEDVYIGSVSYQEESYHQSTCKMFISSKGGDKKHSSKVECVWELPITGGDISESKASYLLESREEGKYWVGRECNIHVAISLIPGHAVNPLAKSNILKELDFMIFPAVYTKDRSPWVLSTSTCSFDPEAASSLVMPVGYDRLSDLFDIEDVHMLLTGMT